MKMKKNIGSSPCFGDGTFDDFCSQSTEKEQTHRSRQKNRWLNSQQKRQKKNQSRNQQRKRRSIWQRSGPTALGMLELLEQNEREKQLNDYQVTLATAPDEVVAKVVSGELDIAAVPTNVAATLYNKTQGGVQLTAR